MAGFFKKLFFNKKASKTQITKSSEPFGYKTTWIAVKSPRKNEITDMLVAHGIAEFNICTIDNQWTLVRGHDLPTLEHWETVKSLNQQSSDAEDYWNSLKNTNCSDESAINILAALSEKYNYVCHYANYRVSSCYSWAKFEDGKIVRGFHYSDDYGMTVNIGEPTAEEQSLGIDFSILNTEQMFDDEERETPGEEHVIEMAAMWSINPLEI